MSICKDNNFVIKLTECIRSNLSVQKRKHVVNESNTKETNLDVFVMNYLLDLLCHGSLELTWFLRKFYGERVFNECSQLSFNTINNKIKFYENSKSLSALLKMCNCPTIDCDIQQTQYVKILSPLYNKIFQSSRKNHECYDCGTVARAVFLSLITVHRKKFYISFEEYKKMIYGYYFDKHPLTELVDFKNQILNGKPGISICGIGIGDKFGHVWNIEKTNEKTKSGNYKYRIYQSALNSYLMYDFLAYMDYPLLESNNSDGWDIIEFFNILESLLLKYNTSQWSMKDNYNFTKLFCFYPSSRNTKDDTLSFSATFIEY
jgi:hypothetical protein